MSKRIRQCNFQHRDAPEKPIASGPPQPIDTKIKTSSSIIKEACIDDRDQHDKLDDGEAELSNVLVSVETMEDDFTCAGPV